MSFEHPLSVSRGDFGSIEALVPLLRKQQPLLLLNLLLLVQNDLERLGVLWGLDVHRKG